MLSTKISEHFTVKEMACPHCGFIPAAVYPAIMDTCLVLEKIRKDVKIPLIISSAYRCHEHNTKKKGDPLSRHMQGLAVDIVCVDNTFRFNLIESAISHKIDKIKVYPNHIHIERSTVDDSSRWFLIVDHPKEK